MFKRDGFITENKWGMMRSGGVSLLTMVWASCSKSWGERRCRDSLSELKIKAVIRFKNELPLALRLFQGILGGLWKVGQTCADFSAL